jgi:TolB-like protein/Tfp pilus assembly protein PilF/predicted Ser/Thr protein kinase
MIGKTISHYKILNKLGEGGMGVVYKALDTRLDRPVALKFLAPQALVGQENKARLVREAKAAAMLSHPSICTVFEIDEAGGETFIAMEFLDGKSLKDLIAAGPMEPLYAGRIASGVAEGLEEAHGKGIVHRDIKPANIMVMHGAHVKIMDFGVAKSAAAPKLTKTGTSLGTVAYMSPEQARGQDVDGRTDIWSLGAVMYEMLAGRAPFEADYEQAVLYKVINEDPAPISSFRNEVPPELTKVIERALQKNPDGRYQRAREMLADLAAVEKPAPAKTPEMYGALKDVTPSIAVLPFANMSPDPENEYFGDGLAEELINALARIEGLRVAARTSAFRFRGKDEDIRQIGAKLNVTYLLEGSVRRSGSRVRVSAQLISVDDGYHLWSERYDRELEDIFAIQDEITEAIVRQLEVKLLPRAGEPLVKRYTDNMEAYSLYLKGSYNWHSLTAEGWTKCKELFEKAIEIDPGFARAYAGLAVHSGSQAFWGDVPPREAFARARELGGTALRLDPDLAEAHALLAVISMTSDWDWSTGERLMKHAIGLDPTDAMSHADYALLLATRGRFEEALAQADLAHKLDPLSPIIGSWVGMVPCYVGRVDDAVNRLEETVTLKPDYWQSHFSLSQAFLYAEDFDKTVGAAQEAVDLSGGAQIAVTTLACAYYLRGNKDEGDKLYRHLAERSRRGYVHASFFAAIHWARGEADDALKWTEKAIEERDNWLCWHNIEAPCIRRTDPRILGALKNAGL